MAAEAKILVESRRGGTEARPGESWGRAQKLLVEAPQEDRVLGSNLTSPRQW